MQVTKRADHTKPICLDSILSKCRKENGVAEDIQPLYIDMESESIKCKWCTTFKGSIETRVINQHVKASKSHIKEHQCRLHPDNNLEGVNDIRTYFQARR